MKEITLKELLETTFTINKKGEMVGEFTLKRINMIGDILTNQYKEIERLKSNEKTLADLLNKEQKKNKKAIEYIEKEKRKFKKNAYVEMHINAYNKKQDELLEILKGDGSNE